MGDFSCLGPDVKLHIDKTIIGNKVTISQGSYLCNGSHDISKLNKPFISSPIIIHDFAWIAADCFVGPGITINEGAVVGARSAVFKDVEAWTVVGGNPAKFIKERKITA
jgi:putative colanic acid biosynthesis acetyltransferase WcaF